MLLLALRQLERRRSFLEILQSDVYLHDQSVRAWDQLARSDVERRAHGHIQGMSH